MPRSTFSATAFRSATPGLGRLASAIAGGGEGAFEQGRQGEIQFQSKLANALAQQRSSSASADLHEAQAQSERAGLAMQAPDAIRRNAMTANAIPLDEEEAVSSFLKSGKLGGKYEAELGPAMPEPEWAGKLGDVARAISGVQTALTIGDKNSENIAKAGSINRESRLSDDIIAGRANRNVVGGAQAAAGGKDLFHADSTGSVLDKFTGNLDTSNPMAGSTISLRKEQAGQAKAGAAGNYAQADNARSHAEQRRQITANGPGPGKVPTGYRYTTGEDGEAKLEPIPGGPKDPNAQTGKPLPASAAKGYLDNHANLQRAEKALALVEGLEFDGAKGDKEATGWKGVLPNQMLNRVDPKGVDTRAAVADLGSLVIHDRSGAAVTASEFPRLAPFIPTVYDDQPTSAKKLRNFVKNYKAIVEDAGEFYKASGYNVPTVRTRGGAVPAEPAKAGAVAAGGFKYLGKE